MRTVCYKCNAEKPEQAESADDQIQHGENESGENSESGEKGETDEKSETDEKRD